MKSWWTKKSTSAYKKREKCIKDQYSEYSLFNIKVNEGVIVVEINTKPKPYILMAELVPNIQYSILLSSTATGYYSGNRMQQSAFTYKHVT